MRRHSDQKNTEWPEDPSREEENPPREEEYPPGVNSNDPPARYPVRNEPERRQSEVASNTRPQHSGCFTVIPPNQTRRNEVQTVAQQGMAVYDRWREESRVQSVHTTPQRLGGGGSVAEAREKQFRESRSSKLQKRLRKVEMDKIKRQEEEEELQRKKDEQRRKAELLEQKDQQEQRRRRQQFQQDRLRTNERLFQQMESPAPDRPASCGATHASSRGDDVEGNRTVKETKSQKEVELDHRRVNSAFLDKLEGGGRGKSLQEVEHAGPEAARNDSFAHLSLQSEQTGSESTGGADPEPDADWSLARLMSRFPYHTEDFLRDILAQCGGDYEQAFTLLSG